MSGILGTVRDFLRWNDYEDEDYSDMEGEEDYSSPYEGTSRLSSATGSQSGLVEGDDEFADLAQIGAVKDRPGRFESRRRSSESVDATSRRSGQREQRSVGSNMSGNVIGLPNVNQITNEVVVVEPRSFDEMAQVIQNLRDRKTVIMNLTLMDPGDAQRSVDFVAGGTYAIDGHQERIGENIFLFTPSTVSVSTPSTTPVQIPMQPMQTPTPIWSTSNFSESNQAVGR